MMLVLYTPQAFTPSKPLDLRQHWKSRYLQVSTQVLGFWGNTMRGAVRNKER